MATQQNVKLPKLSRIHCPTDFSPFSKRALDHAVTIARLYDAEVDVFHVFPVLVPIVGDLTYAATIVRLDDETRRTLTDDLRKFVEPVLETGITVKTSLLEGDPFHEILKRVQNSDSELIVMGTHGLRGFDRWLLGSVTERVLVKAACPVLTVAPADHGPSGPERPAVERILCPLDLSDHSSMTLRYAVSLAQASKSSLTVMHVVEGGSEEEAPGEALSPVPFEREYREHVGAQARERLDAIVTIAAGGVGRIEQRVVRGKAYKEILRTSKELGSDLIVMGIHGHNAVRFSLFGSTTQHVVRVAECPVLTVRPLDGRESRGTPQR